MIEDKKNKILKRVITEKTRPETDNQLNINNTGNNKKKESNDQLQYLQEGETVKINNFLAEDLALNNNNNSKTSLNQDREIVYFKNNLKTTIKDGNLTGSKRFDRYNNPIIHGGGKQKVTFIDKISKANFIEVVKVDSYKKYNKMEEISSTKKNYCCILI